VETQTPPPEDLANYRVAERFADLPVEDLGVNITLNELHPPEDIAALRALGYTDEKISELTRKQAREILGADLKLIAAALTFIPRTNDDPHSENYWEEIEQTPGRNYMVRVGMAVKAETGEAGFPLFLKWRSSGDRDCDADKVRKKWDSFHPTQIGAGTIFWMAEKAAPGWRDEYDAQKSNGQGAPEAPQRGPVPGFNIRETSSDGKQNEPPSPPPPDPLEEFIPPDTWAAI